MRPFKSILLNGLFLSSLIAVLCVSGASAQEQQGTSDRPAIPSVKNPPVSKKQTTTIASAKAEEQSSTATPDAPGDGPELIRKREEWFYKQRSSVNGRIPAGARLKALQHMQRMMVAEGKLVLRPDGSYAEVTPRPGLSPLSAVTSTWNSIGPTPTTGGFFSPVTGRVMTISVDPSDTTGNTVLLGGAMGGIWRSTDAGVTWTAVGDQNASLAMGSIAFAPSSPSTVYAGTGEQSLGFDTYYGAGVLKSTDHGQTWTQTCTVASSTCPFIGPYLDSLNPGFGFLNFGGAHISYLSVNPTNPNMILAGVQLIAEGPKEGVYCSDNGGATWSNVLPDEMATFVGFASSTVAYAAFGNLFGSSPGAPNGNGIYKATGIGSTCSTVHFSRLTATSLPSLSSMGRIDMGIAPSDTTGNTVYASIADSSTASGTNLGVFVTTNGGTSWTQTAAPDICHFQCWYDNVVKVDPNNKSIVFFGGGAVRDSSGNPSWVVRTTNAGTSWSSVIPNLPGGSAGLPHVDNHAIAFVKLPTGKVRMYLGNDGGIWRTDDAEASTITWTNLNNTSLTLTQFYPSISIHATAPSMAFGGTQDNGSQNYQGPGTSWVDNQLCGDGASTAVDSVIPSTVYIGCATGFPVNASYQNGAIGTFSPAIDGLNSSDFSSFIPPLATDPNLANVLYYGTTRLYQSADAGNTWTPISSDLVFGPNGDWINTIAVEPGNSSVVYVGANNGLIFAATNVTPGQSCCAGFIQLNQVGLPPRQVMAIAIDPSDASGRTAYAAFSGFSFVGTDPLGNSVSDPLGHIFKTADGGNTWKDVSCSTTNCSAPALSDLPDVPVNDLVLDPDLPNILYAATDLGVFEGDCSAMPCTWSTLSTGLPRAAVISLRLHEPSRTLRAATHGRGAWDINLNNFTFTGPHISSLSPPSINVGSAQFTLTVNGSGLTNGAVQWNGSATGVTTTQVSDTKLTASIAASLLTVAGTPKITVVNGTQTSNSLSFAVLAGTPALTGISPSSTPVQAPNPTAPVQIQLTGTNFSSNAKVLFNGAPSGITVAAPTAGCPLPTCLAATLPAALLGPFGSTNDISVLNLPPGGGQSKAATFKVVAPPPPNDNFASAINITTLNFGDAQDSSGATTEPSDPTPPCAQQFSSTQGNTGGQPNGVYNTIWYKFTPIFSASLNVDTLGSSYDSVLSIWTGTPGSLVNVACNDDSTQPPSLQSQLLNVPLTAGTTYYIMVSSFGPPDPNPIALGGASSLHFLYNNGFTPTPSISSLSPTSANSGDKAFTLTVNGTGFLNGASVQFLSSELFFGYTPEPTTFVSSTQLTAAIPASAIALPGPASVVVANPQPTIGTSNALSFTVNVGTYPVPNLVSLSPTSVLATTQGTTVDAAGDLFAPNAVLNFNGVPEATTVVNPKLLYAVIPASQLTVANVGTVQVSVSNPTPGGGPSSSLPFTIVMPNPIPTITSINPSSAPANQQNPFPINIVGTNFQQGAIATFNGSSMQTTLVSATQITMTVFPNFLTSVGTFPIVVIDPAPGGTSNAVSFTVTPPPPPTITSISPSIAQTGTSPTLTITGTGFQQGATILFNSSTFPANYMSSTQLTAVISLAGVAAGTYPLAVVDPQPVGASASVNFTVTDFSITSSGTTTQTVNAGQTATFTNVISVAAQNGFASQVNLSCSLPVAAANTTCTVNPSVFASGSGTASVSVTTMAHGLLPPSLPFRRFFLRPELFALSVLTLLLAILMLRIARTRRLRLAGALPFGILVLFILLQAIGCGGGSSTPPPPTGTPAGTYTVTVTGASGNTVHSATLTLTVN